MFAELNSNSTPTYQWISEKAVLIRQGKKRVFITFGSTTSGYTAVYQLEDRDIPIITTNNQMMFVYNTLYYDGFFRVGNDNRCIESYTYSNGKPYSVPFAGCEMYGQIEWYVA